MLPYLGPPKRPQSLKEWLSADPACTQLGLVHGFWSASGPSTGAVVGGGGWVAVGGFLYWPSVWELTCGCVPCAALAAYSKAYVDGA